MENQRSAVESYISGFWSLPWPELMDRVAFGSLLVAVAFTPLSESIKNITFGISIFATAVSVAGRKPRRLVITQVGWMHILFFGMAALSALQAISVWQGFRGAWDILRYLLFFLLVVNLCSSERRLLTVAGVFVGSTAFGALLGLGTYGVHLMDKWAGRPHPRLMAVHVHSLGHPNHTATYLLMMIALALGLRLYVPLSRRMRLGLDTCLGLLVAALIFTFSRSAFATFLFLMFVLLIYLRQLKFAGVAIAVLLSAALLWRVTGTPSKKRLSEIFQPWKSIAVKERVVLWTHVSLGVVKDRPLFGAGPRNFNLVDKQKYGVSKSWNYYNHAHSMYFNVLTETGILGFGAFLLWLLAGVWAWWRAQRGPNSQLGRALCVAYLGALITLSVSGIVTTTLHTEGAIAYSSLMGLLLAWVRLRGSPQTSEAI